MAVLKSLPVLHNTFFLKELVYVDHYLGICLNANSSLTPWCISSVRRSVPLFGNDVYFLSGLTALCYGVVRL